MPRTKACCFLICLLTLCCMIYPSVSHAEKLPYAELITYSIDYYGLEKNDKADLLLFYGYTKDQIDSIDKEIEYHRVWFDVRIKNMQWNEYYDCVIRNNCDSVDILVSSASFIEQDSKDNDTYGYIWAWINTQCDINKAIHQVQLMMDVVDEESGKSIYTIPVNTSLVIENRIPSDGFTIQLERAKVYPLSTYDLIKSRYPLPLREMDLNLSKEEQNDISIHPENYWVCTYQGTKHKSMDKNVYNIIFGTPLERDNVWISRSNCHSYGYLGDADSSDCDDMTEDGGKYIEIRLLIHADSEEAAREIIQETQINAYFSSMCYYDYSGVNISGPIQHIVSVDISNIPVFFIK